MPADPARTPTHDVPADATAPRRAALVLVNLGTPGAPTPAAVRRYLLEFLSDRRVVQLPPLLWQPLLRAVVLPRRSHAVAEKYAQIWMDGGSPLAVHTQLLADAVRQRLPGVHVVHAMRYGAPSLASTLRALREAGCERVLVLPLYPQYSTTTTASVRDVVAAALPTADPRHGGAISSPHPERSAGRRAPDGADADAAPAPGSRPPVAASRPQPSAPAARIVDDYHRDPGWVAAVAASIRAHWTAHGRSERLLFSFHGIPQRVVDGGDPYAAQCEASTGAIAAALGIGRDDVLLTYQSRFGRARWLQPYTLPTLQALAREGVRSIDIACPGFAVDCLETLEEIAMQNAEAFRAAGGQALRYIPCLNDAPAHADALAALARRHLAAWTDAEVAA